MLDLIFALASTPGGGFVPSLTGASVSRVTAGACNPSGGITIAAKILVGWTLTNPNDVDYTMKIYENGALLGTALTSDTGYTKTISGYVESTVSHENSSTNWSANWTYRVDLVRNSDGAVIGTQTTGAWLQTYGACL